MPAIISDLAATRATIPFSLTYSPTPTIGNVVLEHTYAVGGTATPTAAMTNPLTRLATDNNFGGAQYQHSFLKQVASGDSATFTYSDTGTYNTFNEIIEVSGVNGSLDGTPTIASAATVTSLAAGSITTTVANSIVFVWFCFNGAVTGAMIGSGFTLLANTGRILTGYLVVPTPTTVSPTATWTTGRSAGATMYALQPTGSSPVPPTVLATPVAANTSAFFY